MTGSPAPFAVRKPGFWLGASFDLAWSPDGTRLAALGKRPTIWDVGSRRRLATVRPFPYISHVDVALDGTRCVVKNTAGDVAVIHLDTAIVRLMLPGEPYGEGDAVHFSPCGDFLVDSSWRGDLLVRDASTGAIVFHEQTRASRLSTTYNRQLWAYLGDDGTLSLRRWPFEANGATVYEMPYASALALSPDATHVATADSENVTVWTLDGANIERVAQWRTTTSGTGDHLAWSPEADLLAYAGGQAAVLFDASLNVQWLVPFDYPSAVAFSYSGELLAIGDWSKGAVVAL